MTHPFRVALQTLERIAEVMEAIAGEKLEDRANARNYDAAAKRADPWLAWAMPAIQEVLAEHVMTWRNDRIECWSEDGSRGCMQWFQDQQEWREHVAPLIASRIGCDPPRAIQALRNYRPDRVRP